MLVNAPAMEPLRRRKVTTKTRVSTRAPQYPPRGFFKSYFVRHIKGGSIDVNRQDQGVMLRCCRKPSGSGGRTSLAKSCSSASSRSPLTRAWDFNVLPCRTIRARRSRIRLREQCERIDTRRPSRPQAPPLWTAGQLSLRRIIRQTSSSGSLPNTERCPCYKG